MMLSSADRGSINVEEGLCANEQADEKEYNALYARLNSGPDPQANKDTKIKEWYGTFKPEAMNAKECLAPRSLVQLWLNRVVSLLALAALAGVVFSKIPDSLISMKSSTPQVVTPPVAAPQHANLKPTLTAPRQVERAMKRSPSSPVRNSTAPVHHIPPTDHGHCVDRNAALCKTWFPKNGSAAGVHACQEDKRLSHAACPRSCGHCALALGGCQKLKVVDVGSDCKEGEDVVGQVCANDDGPSESYCTYLPPERHHNRSHPLFVCARCADPAGVMTAERRVILGQIQELRSEEIAREDEKLEGEK